MDMLEEQAAALLRSVGAGLGLELQPDSTGACGLRIDDRLDVTLRYEPNPPSLLAYSHVGALPDGPVEDLLRRLLEENHVWDGSRGSTWSLSGGSVVLSRLFALAELESREPVERACDIRRGCALRPGGLVEPSRLHAGGAADAALAPGRQHDHAMMATGAASAEAAALSPGEVRELVSIGFHGLLNGKAEPALRLFDGSERAAALRDLSPHRQRTRAHGIRTRP